MRKLLRSIAKARMQMEGVPHPCRKHNALGVKKDSVFSQYWRKFVNIDTPIKQKNKKKRRARKAFA